MGTTSVHRGGQQPPGRFGAWDTARENLLWTNMHAILQQSPDQAGGPTLISRRQIVYQNQNWNTTSTELRPTISTFAVGPSSPVRS